MDAIISTFQIDWKIIIAQLVNFAIVVFVLWYFAFKPLAKKMTERTNKIEKSLQDASEIEKRLNLVGEENEKRIIASRKEAETIIQQGQLIAEKQKQEAVAKTKEEAAKVVAVSKQQIVLEKEKMVKEIKQEIGELVTAAAEKIIREKLDDKKNQEIIEEVIKKI